MQKQEATTEESQINECQSNEESNKEVLNIPNILISATALATAMSNFSLKQGFCPKLCPMHRTKHNSNVRVFGSVQFNNRPGFRLVLV